MHARHSVVAHVIVPAVHRGDQRTSVDVDDEVYHGTREMVAEDEFGVVKRQGQDLQQKYSGQRKVKPQQK